MNYNYAHQLAEIIIKIWLNKASEQERERLLSWLDENEENRQTYKNIISGETLLKRLKSEEKISETIDFDAISRKIAKKLLERRSQRKVIHTLYYATGFLLILISGWIFWPGNRVKDEPLAMESSKVKLILASGSVINLDKTAPDSIDATAALIIKDQSGLTYKSKDKEEDADEAEIIHKIVTETGGEYSFVLSDGTKVWLNSLSEIEFPVSFKKGERVINLTGEAYFEVAHDPKRPFIVHSLNQTVQVLGTSFNIKAYSEESMVYTTLVEGKITVGSGGNKVVLTPGMESVCLRSNNGIETYKVNTDLSTAWRSGYFMFNEQDLGEMLKVLQRWYGYEFNYNSQIVGSNTFSGRFNKYSDLENTLNSITLAGGPEFIIDRDNKNITIKKRTN
jgi:ferric-dicitrate binding protein FerR (iron transport regulator)